MNDLMPRIAFAAVATPISVCLTKYWIETLYRECDPAILSYPEKLAAPSRLRLPLLSAASALSFFFLAALPDPILLARGAIGIFFLFLCCVTDFEQQVIFDKVLAPFALAALPFSLLLRQSPQDLALAAIVGGGAFFALVLVTRGAIGMGDAKLIAALGLWVGSENLLAIAVSGILLAGIVAILLLILRLKGRKDYIAFGPYFALPALLFFLG